MSRTYITPSRPGSAAAEPLRRACQRVVAGLRVDEERIRAALTQVLAELPPHDAVDHDPVGHAVARAPARLDEQAVDDTVRHLVGLVARQPQAQPLEDDR